MEQRSDGEAREVALKAGTPVTSSMRHAGPWADVAAGGLAFSLVALLAANEGGYWPVAWSWTAFLLAWVAILALLLVARVELTRAEQALLVASFALLGWVALAVTWSDSVPRTMLEVQRVAAYAAIVVASVVVVRSRSYGSLLVGASAGITVVSAYSLATRLLPERLGQFDPIAGYRLSEPVGYWNALGLLAVLGILLAVGVAARGHLVTSALAAASLLILVPTLYFTFSRGAWAALAAGLMFTLAVDRRRLQFGIAAVVLAICPAVAVAVARSSDPLTDSATASLPAVVRDGHRLALVLVGLAIVQAVILVVFRLVERRLQVPAGVVRVATGSAVTVAVLAVIVGVVRLGGPEGVADRVHDGFFTRSPPSGLNERLFSLSNNGRADLWAVAWRSFEQTPVLGTGPGTYEIAWLRERPNGQKVRDAHNLYAESLAEVGLVGTGVIILVLLLPFVALRRGRHHSLVPVALGAYVAFLAHAGVDWDWEMSAVTGAGLLCGVAALAASRSPQAGRRSHPGAWGATAAVMLAVAVFSLAGIVGNGALEEADDAARAGAPARAERAAERAETWQPWSAEALRIAGEAQLGLGRRVDARSTFSRAVARDPQNWELWFDLAVASDGRARARAARQAERLNPLSPQIASAREQLGLEPVR